MQSAYKCISGLLAGLCLVTATNQRQIQAQTIAPAADGTGTSVIQTGDRHDISGGQLSRDGANLFHSFTQFGLPAGQTANFLSNPSIQNILGRVTGGNASIINGLIQVTGGNSNLFLMNPAGIIFGPNASLNVPASFFATTANGIGFGSNWFNAIGTNNYADLVGAPNIFAFTMKQPGAIVNYGNLSVSDGQNLVLAGGTVLFPRSLRAETGYVTAIAVPGESVARISQPGMVLKLDVKSQANADTLPENWSLPIVSLPELLTGGGMSHASELTVTSDGKVLLAGSGIQVESGDVAVRSAVSADRGSIFLSAYRAIATGNIESISQSDKVGEITLEASSNISTNNITSSSPKGSGLINLYSKAGNISTGNISSGTSGDIRGDGGLINLIAGGNISTGELISQTPSGSLSSIHLLAFGDISTSNLSSISERGDGGIVSLVSKGNVAAGDLRAQTYSGNFSRIVIAASGNVTTNNLSSSSEGNGGSIDILARGDITAGELRAQTHSGNGGSVNLSAGRNVNTRNLYSQSVDGNGGSINIEARGAIATGERFSQPQQSKPVASESQTSSAENSNNNLVSREFLSFANAGKGGSINIQPGSEMTFISPQKLPVYIPPEIYQAEPPALSKQVEGNSPTEVVEPEAAPPTLRFAKEDASGSIADMSAGAIQQIEERGYQAYSNFLGQNLQPMLVPNIPEMLGNISKEIGVNHAVIYVRSYPEELELLLVSAEGKIVRKTIPEANQEVLMRKAKEFYKEVSDRYITDFPASEQLYQWLIAPLEPELKARGINGLMFVLDEGLRSLPMAALYDGQHFLIEKYSISLIPIISLIDARYVGLKNAKVLAMGRSEFSALGQEPLPGVPAELSAIAQEWGGDIFLDRQFTFENLKARRNSQQFRIVHIATHANFQPGEGRDKSYIQLWDTKLRLDRLRELEWYNSQKVELLVLSACETALGDKYAEMGFAGLALQTGAKSAIASLWRVKDASTLGLMREFYKQLKIAPTKAEALRRAQIAMRQGRVVLEDTAARSLPSGDSSFLPLNLTSAQRENNYSHPYYWAAFTTIGSPW